MDRATVLDRLEKSMQGPQTIITMADGPVHRGVVLKVTRWAHDVEVYLLDPMSFKAKLIDLDYEDIKSITAQELVPDPTGPVSSILWTDAQYLEPTSNEDCPYQDIDMADELLQWFMMRTFEDRDLTFSSSPDELNMFQLFIALWAADAGL